MPFLLFLYWNFPRYISFYDLGLVTPIRLNDLVVIFIFLLFLNRSFRIDKTAVIVLFYLFFNAVFFATLNWDFKFLLGFLRLFEYFIVGFSLYLTLLSNKNYIFILVLPGLVLSFFQFFLIIPVFDGGRGIFYSSQFSGLFNTPADFSYFICCLLFILAFVSRFKFTISRFLVLFSDVRAVIIPLILGLGQLYPLYVRYRFWLFGIFVLSLFCFFFFWILIVDSYIIQFGSVSNRIVHDSLFNFSHSDIALSQRLGKWATVINTCKDSILCIAFGNGFYSFDMTLDGGLIRIIYEFGIPVVLVLVFFLFKFAPGTAMLFISTNLFYDSLSSSVVAPLFVTAFFVERLNFRNPRFF